MRWERRDKFTVHQIRDLLLFDAAADTTHPERLGNKHPNGCDDSIDPSRMEANFVVVFDDGVPFFLECLGFSQLKPSVEDEHID